MNRVLLAGFLGFTLLSTAYGGGTVTWPTPPLPPDANRAATAVAPILGWLNRFHQNVVDARKMPKVDIIFDGDILAITNGQYGPQGGMWQSFTKWKAVDFSSPGDPLQSVLWRLQQGQADGLHAKLVVLTIGDSNLAGGGTPEQVAEGIKAVVAEYQKRCPEAVILLQGLFPHGEKPTDPYRAKAKAVNQLIAPLGDGKKVIYLDFSDIFLQPDGTISRDIMADFSRPAVKGYPLWANAILPTVNQVCPVSSLKDVTASGLDSETKPVNPAPFPGGTVTWPSPPVPAGANPAIIPAVGMGWLPHFQQNIDDAQKMKSVDIILDGDSITAGWRGGAWGQVWNKYYGKINTFDFGISGDSTQGLLWRVQNGQVAGLHPKLVVLLIGTNNMYANSAEQIAGGIKADVEEYEKQCPDATILLQGVLPRGEQPTDALRAKVKAVNKIISALGDGKKVIFLDWGDKLLTPEGLYTMPITHDFLHFGMPGYQIWASSIEPVVSQIFPGAVTPQAPVPAPATTNATPATPAPPAPATTNP